MPGPGNTVFGKKGKEAVEVSPPLIGYGGLLLIYIIEKVVMVHEAK